MSDKPVDCRPEAYVLFREQLPLLETLDGLWRSAAAVALHAIEDLSLEDVDQRLEALAERVRAGSRSGRDVARVTYLHEVLFEEEGFCGDFERYSSPLNSYLPVVLESRRGLPILLALVYKVVGERVGLRVEGIHSPGHFLARVAVDGQWMIVDPFFHGQVLTRDEALARLSQLTGHSYFGQDDVLQTATHRQWIARILANLQNSFATAGRQNDLSAMSELQELLWASA
ncbi:MAG: transglutaminase-like domain-containing protein [Pirellulales bacterium]